MKRKTVLCIFCLALSLPIFGQDVNAQSRQIPAVVLTVPNLKEQAEKINQKEQEINSAATSSRAKMMQLKEELSSLNREYKVLLSDLHSSTTDLDTKTALEQEIHFVEQQLEVKTQR